MAATASLSVLLQAVTGDFDKKMKRSSKNVSTMSSVVKKASKVFVAFGVAAIAGATATITALTKAGLTNVDAIGKMSQRLGIATERLLELQFAAKLTAGVNDATLNMALQRMTRRLAEAAQGTGEAVKALDELGLSAQDLARLSPDEQFKAIADAMQNLPSQADKVRIAFKLFDSEGVALVNTLALGSAGITKMGDDLAMLGGTFDKFGAAQVSAANDAIARLTIIAKGLSNTLAIELAPVIAELARRTEEWIIASGGINSVVVPALDRVIDKLSGLESIFSVIRAIGNLIQGVARIVLAAITAVVGGIVGLGRLIGVFSQETFDTVDSLFTELVDGIESDFAQVGESLGDALDPRVADDFFRAAAKGAKDVADAAAEGAKKIVEAPVKAIDESLKRLAKTIIERTRTPLERFTEDMKKLQEVFEKGLIPQEVFDREAKRLKEIFTEATKPPAVKEIESLAAPSGGGRTFRFRESIEADRVEKEQLTVLEEIREAILNPKPNNLIIVKEVGV